MCCREAKESVCVFVRGQRRQSGQVIEAGCASLSLCYSVKSLGDHLQLHRDAGETGAQGFLVIYWSRLVKDFCRGPTPWPSPFPFTLQLYLSPSPPTDLPTLPLCLSPASPLLCWEVPETDGSLWISVCECEHMYWPAVENRTFLACSVSVCVCVQILDGWGSLEWGLSLSACLCSALTPGY